MGAGHVADLDAGLEDDGIAGRLDDGALEIQARLLEPGLGGPQRSLLLAELGLAQGELLVEGGGVVLHAEQLPLPLGHVLLALFGLEFVPGGFDLGFLRDDGQLVILGLDANQHVAFAHQTAFDEMGVNLDNSARSLGLKGDLLGRNHRAIHLDVHLVRPGVDLLHFDERGHLSGALALGLWFVLHEVDRRGGPAGNRGA